MCYNEYCMYSKNPGFETSMYLLREFRHGFIKMEIYLVSLS